MIDAKTLNVGDIVVFGGNLELTVASVRVDFLNWEGERHFTYFNEPFWKIAELKKPKLPEFLNFYALVGDKYSDRCQPEYVVSPSRALRSLKMDVARLEAAGVKETE